METDPVFATLAMRQMSVQQQIDNRVLRLALDTQSQAVLQLIESVASPANTQAAEMDFSSLGQNLDLYA